MFIHPIVRRSSFGKVVLLLVASTYSVALGQEPPKDWIEPATGHRVIRLSSDGGTASLYFHQRSYTEDGDKLFVTLRDGLGTIDLRSLGKGATPVEQIAEGRAGSPIVGKKSRQVFYSRDGGIWATHMDTKATREIVKLPPGFSGASGLAINADETLLASTGSVFARPRGGSGPGSGTAGAREGGGPLAAPQFGRRGRGAFGNGSDRSMVLFTVNIATGEIKPVYYERAWLNHTQFSTTDPQQILFCHEGTWQEVDRIWTIRADGSGLKLLHPRTMPMEIAGHEFFGHDGKTVWYDLQTPRSSVFWLAGVNIETGERIRYPIERDQWSVHFNQSHDGKLFAGDGGGPNSVANRSAENRPLDKPGNGQWIYLFTPTSEPLKTMNVAGQSVKIGKFNAERLVDLSKHDYELEPNLTFTPDNKWIVFRSNMHGATHTYAVEIAKAK
jgi:oligogalacturonide lyase